VCHHRLAIIVPASASKKQLHKYTITAPSLNA
jgi:hypothetical protein